MGQEKKDSFGISINEWADKLKEISPRMAEKIYEGPNYKPEMIKKLKERSLPYLETVITELSEFNKNKKNILDKFKYFPYFTNIIRDNGERKRRANLDSLGIDNFINEIVPRKSEYEKYKILISESPPMPYSGALIINSPKRLVLEMIKGPLPNLINYNLVPEYMATRSDFDISIKYKGTNNTQLKKEMYEVIQLTNFEKGYYEFCLAKINSKDNKLKPFFFEYSDKKTYRLKEN